MCQMYAIFEEVIGPQPAGTFKGVSSSPNDEDQGVVADTPTAPHDAPSTDLYAPKRPPQRLYSAPSSLYQSRYASTLPRSNGRRRLDDLDDSESVCSSNPLLDTISVLTYDPPDDADDYYDLGEDEGDSSKPGKSRPEGDRDSVGYAGSSSIDSGYKSFCPTPEIPDPSMYYDQGGKTKPRIMMGTKVISSRQGHVSPLRESPGSSRRSDSSLYDVNLDHLMYLRQSLLSAIQKCEKSSEGIPRTDPPEPPSNNPVDDEHYLDQSPSRPSSATYTKTVRFNTDLEGANKETSQTSDSKVQQQKSILKDPLCANLRSQLEAGGGAADCTLEEEIDSLLYGRAEFYDLESVDDFPCSYVTMIEEKYRSGKPSIAKVRKLKGEKSTEQPSTKPSSSATDTPTTTSTPAEPTPSTTPPLPPDDTRQQTTTKPPTVSISKTAKCRFTEVARCMLEIIEDLQLKKEAEQADGGAPPTSVPKPPAAPSVTDSYAAAAEYHVYEEIDYDFLTAAPRAPEVPPPLPARPNGMKPVGRKRLPSPPSSRKPRCPQRRAEGPATEVRNRPKQRGNLYCLFADRVERRNISRSLEREWRDNGSSDNHEDDYGFKKDFPSI